MTVRFAAMLLLAAANQSRLTPALGSGLANSDPVLAVRDLKQGLTLEAAAAAAILALVAWLGTSRSTRRGRMKYPLTLT